MLDIELCNSACIVERLQSKHPHAGWVSHNKFLTIFCQAMCCLLEESRKDLLCLNVFLIDLEVDLSTLISLSKNLGAAEHLLSVNLLLLVTWNVNETHQVVESKIG